ncbi:MAG: translation elongation factor Ts [Verrucomicrobiota bacterium]|nr:translation elongation factor Ts [Verrucomicrobiota bacterium]
MDTPIVEISAKLVAELRAKTNASMMDCKKALQTTAGDLEKAIDELRKRGQAISVKKSGRETKEGVIAGLVKSGGDAGVLVEVACETDFVARNIDFQNFVKEVSELALSSESPDFKDQTVTAISKLGENIVVRRTLRYSLQGKGLIGTYIHLGAKVGVILEVGADSDKAATNEAFRIFVKDIMLHIAALSPAVVSREQISQDLIKREREIFAAQITDKPANVLEKIVEGKMNKRLAELTLMDQGFVKNPEVTVKEHASNLSKTIGETVVIRRFSRFLVGEETSA